MTATIVHLFTRRKKLLRPHPDTASILAREIMREYDTFSLEIVGKAIEASNVALAGGGTFIDALEAADKSVQRNHFADHIKEEAHRNFERLMLFRRRRARFAEALLRVAEVHIRSHLQQAAENDVQAAIDRARRILGNGGDIGRALHLALPDDISGVV
jgi:hypothetical protein